MSSKGALVLVRMDSQRFPGKATAEFGDKKLIDWCLDGIAGEEAFRTILATTDRAIDDQLEEVAVRRGIPCFRGAFENIAQRVRDCATFYELEFFARVNGDSPFVRGELLREGFNTLDSGEYDIVTNLLPRTFPYGISVEIIRTSLFVSVYEKLARNPRFREHFTTYFYEQPERFRIFSMKSEEDFSDVRLVVDEPEDLVALENLLRQDGEVHRKPLGALASLYRKGR